MIEPSHILVALISILTGHGRHVPYIGRLPSIEGYEIPVFISGILAYFASGGAYTLWLAYKTLPRDIGAAVRYLRCRLLIFWAQRNNLSVAQLFERNVDTSSHRTAIIFEGKKWTVGDLSEYSNRVANYLVSKGVKRGDTIALLMHNRPEYVATWLAASKIGAITALINYNLRHKSLYHCIAVAKCSFIICGEDLQDSINEISSVLSSIPIFVSGAESNKVDITISDAMNLDEGIKQASSALPEQIKKNEFGDRLLYIYTSGTTGLPKAAVVTNARYMFYCSSVHFLIDLDEDDVIYNPLPLYHTAGGMVGIGQTLLFNCTAVIRKKFSASQYWPECNTYGCTVAQYVGEICRYLLNSPERATDKQHKVKVMFGNGVRPQIWEEFTSRFNMPRIAEFYGATEGNANIMNYEGKPGACGFVSMLFPSVYPVKLIKVSKETGQPVRGPDGLCIRCKPGEPGEFVGKIIKKDPLREFSGYADDAATEKKVVRDVFTKGDMAFLSGDLLECDEFGYVYFKDRTGDTFRWRGENVSTTEVEGHVSVAAGNADAVVFGVEVPGTEGKAGMGVIVQTPDMPSIDMDKFLDRLKKEVPVYAIPLFIRIVTNIDTTGTFKLKKVDLQKEGYNLPLLLKEKGEDHMLYFLQQRPMQYVPLTPDLLQKILHKEVGL